MSKALFTKKQLEVITLLRENPTWTYEQIDDELGLKHGTTGNRVQSIRDKIKVSQKIVNVTNGWKKASPRLRKVLI